MLRGRAASGFVGTAPVLFAGAAEDRRQGEREMRRDLFASIKGYDNRQRIHSAIGCLTPEQAERKAS